MFLEKKTIAWQPSHFLPSYHILLLMFGLTEQIFPGSTSGFPLFSPFTVEIIRFQGLDWLYLEILAIVIVGIIAILDRKISIITDEKLKFL